ncbi:MAG: Holliday junction branch migration protein RuvA [Patescibacteria group bacterium]|nr:Holliday junction branch migration protein RuvA [Patescibacteria group bacterium]
MISHVKGKVIHKDLRFVVIDTNGVGYKIFATIDTINKLKNKVSIWTHLSVRENALDLYGFISIDELSFFELLITISGIGPKTALGILNVASINTIRNAIASGDTSHLTKVSGIGKKNADKIVLELKNKIGSFESDNIPIQQETDAMEALISLGYSQSTVREVLKNIPKEITDVGKKIKAGLKILGK